MKRTGILILAALVTATGCTSDAGGLSRDEILAQAPVVGGPPKHAPESFPGGLARDEAERRLAEARDAFLSERYDECLKIVRGALEEGSPHEVADELRSLQYEAKRKLVSRTLVCVRALPDRDVLPMGEEARFDLVLRNVSEIEVRIPRTLGESSGTVFFLSVTREDWDVYGNVRTETVRELVPIEDDLVLAPGEQRKVPFSVPTPEPEARHRGFTVMRVSGVLRPAAIEGGEQAVYSGVDLIPGEARILPPGYEPLATDPVASIRKAHALAAREHLLVAAALVPRESRGRAIGALIDLLGDGTNPATVTVMASLRFLTGRSFANRPESWRAWWREEGANGLD